MTSTPDCNGGKGQAPKPIGNATGNSRDAMSASTGVDMERLLVPVALEVEGRSPNKVWLTARQYGARAGVLCCVCVCGRGGAGFGVWDM